MNDNQKFQELKAKHPEWSEEQIWTAISLDLETDKVIEKKGNDVDPDDPNIVEEIIRGAMDWLNIVFPQIFENVKIFFQGLLNNIGNWIKQGLRYLIEHINIYF